jgi:hypothetical protein
VIEHTPDGHHPIGWSWGSEWYLADFYLCLTRAIIQRAEKVGLDLKEKPRGRYRNAPSIQGDIKLQQEECDGSTI